MVHVGVGLCGKRVQTMCTCILQKLGCEVVLQHVYSTTLGVDKITSAMNCTEFAKPNSGKFQGKLLDEHTLQKSVINSTTHTHTSLIQRVSCLLGTDHVWT